MPPQFSLKDDTFTIQNYNQARPFSSFLPGIAGEFGKPMWVFYTNRGQCLASFGVHNKNSAMLEFNPANKAYEMTPWLGFRTFLRFGKKGGYYEPFRVIPDNDVQQTLRIRPEEIEIEEIHKKLGLRIRVAYFNAPNEDVPVLIRLVQLENLGKKAIAGDLLD